MNVVVGVHKILLSVIIVVSAGYSQETFGPGMWSYVFFGIAAFIVVSVFVRHLDLVAKGVGIAAGDLAAVALVLLLVAGTIGGGEYNLSESNETFAFMLGGITVLGLGAVLWHDRMASPRPGASEQRRGTGPRRRGCLALSDPANG